MRVAVVVPTYNEAETIVEVCERIRGALPDAEIVVVDDASPDGTAERARAAGERVGRVVVLERHSKDGLGAAYRAGFTLAIERGADVCVQLDADLSHDPAAFPSLQDRMTDGIAMVIGSRYVPGGSIPHWPLHRRLLSRWGNRYTRWVLGMRVADTTSGFRLWRAETIETTKLLETRSRGYLFQIENAYRVVQAGEGLAEVPISFTDRVRGRSKMSGAVIWEELSRVTWWAVRDRVLRRPPQFLRPA